MKNFLENFITVGGFLNSNISDSTKTLSYQDFFKKTDEIACYLSNVLSFQSKVTIVADSSINWLLCDFALLKSGLISIPMFANASNETLKFQIEQSMPECLIAESNDVLEKILKITNHTFKHVFLIDELIEKSNETLPLSHIHPKTIATIIYTSGTNGMPKGVMLTHSNFAYQIQDISSSFSEISDSDVAISILPFAHVFQRTIMYFYLSQGVSLHIVNDIQNILKHIEKIQPTLTTVVPRILEKIYSRIKNQIQSKPKIIHKLFEETSLSVIKNPVKKFILDILIFKKVRGIFGKQMKLVVCGGAKLNQNEEMFFYNAKVPVCQGYGMTECSPVISSNNLKNHKLFTVGKPFNSVDIKIAENDEICIRGNSVFYGYLNQEPRKFYEFFSTGDVGSIDSDGFLTITGRIKDQCKTANGKFVNLVKIETMLNEIFDVENACIIAEGRPFVTAIIFSKKHTDNSLQKHIDDINQKLDHHEQIQYFYITNEIPTPENNLITPSMKIRRTLIQEKFRKEIENLYITHSVQ